jgi:hypothetical protein
LRRRILESLLLSLVWLGPLLVAPGALAWTRTVGGTLAPTFLLIAGAFIGARRGPRRSALPLFATAGVAELWALSAESSGEVAIFGLSLLGCWLMLGPLARTLEPVDALESRFLLTLVADATAILASVSLAVLFDLRVELGGLFAVGLAIAGMRTPIARVRAGIAILAGGLLDAWLGLPGLLELGSDDALRIVELDDVIRRSAVLASAAVLGAMVLSQRASGDAEPPPERPRKAS